MEVSPSIFERIRVEIRVMVIKTPKNYHQIRMEKGLKMLFKESNRLYLSMFKMKIDGMLSRRGSSGIEIR